MKITKKYLQELIKEEVTAARLKYDIETLQAMVMGDVSWIGERYNLDWSAEEDRALIVASGVIKRFAEALEGKAAPGGAPGEGQRIHRGGDQ